MPRKKLNKHRLHVMVDADLLETWNLVLINPETGRPLHGALSAIVNKLLRRLLDKVREPDADMHAVMRAFGIEMSELEKLK